MKSFNGYDDAKKAAQTTASAKLPAGGYVCKILGVKYEEGTNGNSDKITLQFDISEGEYKDFFTKQYESNTAEDKKFKGRVAVYVPKDDGSEKDSWTKKSFAGWTDAFEKSNPGYVWDWDEKKWKGKLVGIVFGETGTVIEGKDIIYTEARFAVDADKIRNNNYPAAKFKSKNGYGESAPAGFVNVPDGVVEDLPFK